MAPRYPGVRIALNSSIHMKIHSFNDMNLQRTLVLILGVLKKKSKLSNYYKEFIKRSGDGDVAPVSQSQKL